MDLILFLFFITKFLLYTKCKMLGATNTYFKRVVININKRLRCCSLKESVYTDLDESVVADTREDPLSSSILVNEPC